MTIRGSDLDVFSFEEVSPSSGVSYHGRLKKCECTLLSHIPYKRDLRCLELQAY